MNTLLDSGTPQPAAPSAPDQTATATTTKGAAQQPKSYARWKSQIEESRRVREKLVENEWRDNVNYRRMRPFKEKSADESLEDRVAVPVDWSFTKAKEAGLFSQVPQVILTAASDKYKPAVPVMQKELNDVLTKQVKVGVTMEECLADVINASGIAAAKVGYMATFQTKQMPDQDLSAFQPETQQALLDQGIVKMVPVPQRVDCRFYANRISPARLLWPKEFKGSDFDDADWLGYDGEYTWATALREFGKTDERPNGLTPEMKEEIFGQSSDDQTQQLVDDLDMKSDDHRVVQFTEIFYNAAKQDPNEVLLDKIRRIVFVRGLDTPVIDEDFKWQQWMPQTESFIGLTKYPIRVVTLTYISDMAVPPSDSEIGRPQVDEQMRSRSQMILQRDRSAPMRWANVNRVDPMILQNLMRGDFQQIIPVNGDGNQALGEVARANYPSEDWDFDRVARQDLMDAWQVGPNQTGTFNASGHTAAESNIVQANFATRQAKERAKISKFFLSIAECVAGLMQLFYDGPKEQALIGQDGQQRLQSAWDRKTISGAQFVFSIQEDSQVKLDSQQQLDRITKFLNLTAKSGFVNVKAVVEQIALLSGMDPAAVVVDPTPKPPDQANVSLRIGGADLQNPIVGPYLIALMQKSDMVAPQDIELAKQLLIASSTVQPSPQGAPTQPSGPQQPPLPPGAAPQPPENYGPMERVSKRINEPGG